MKINIKTFLAAAAMALATTACNDALDESLANEGLDGSHRIAAPTLAAFPTFATAQGTNGMSDAISRAVPGGGTADDLTQQKTKWEVGDSVLVEYHFITYRKANEEGYSEAEHYTTLFTTYTVVAVAADAPPTLAISGGAWMLKYKYDSNSRTYNDYSLTAIPAAEMAAGVPVPETVQDDTYNAWAWYAPGSAWTAMDGISDEPIPASDLPGWNSSKYLKMEPRAITAANVGKGCRASTGVSGVSIGTAPAFTYSWSLYGSRLRIHALPGDAVTLSGDFRPTNSTGSLNDTSRPKHWADAEGTTLVDAPSSVTATADANGNAWFYGWWENGATLTVSLKSDKLTQGKEMAVFQTKTTSESNTGNTFAINAIEPLGAFYGKAAELLTTDDSGNKVLSDAAKDAKIWYVTDDGTLNYYNDVKTAIGITTNNIELYMPNVTTITEQAFIQCNKLTAVSMDKVETIGDEAFSYCSSLKTASMDNVKTISNSAFLFCTSLETASMDNVEAIGDNAFSTCTSLKAAIMDKVVKVGSNTFEYCNNLETVSMDKVKTVGANAFNLCTKLATVSMENVETVEESAFLSCSSLKTVSMDKVKTISNNAFAGCAFTTLSLPETVTSIGGNAFSSCQKLTTVKLPNVSSLGRQVFFDCTVLTSLTFGTGITAWGIQMLAQGVTTTNIDLTLSKDQKEVTSGGGDDSDAVFGPGLYSESTDYTSTPQKFAGYKFKSVTLQ